MARKIQIKIIEDIYQDWPEPIPDYHLTAGIVLNQFGQFLALEHHQDSSKVVYVHPCTKRIGNGRVHFKMQKGCLVTSFVNRLWK